ncbi:hypothetical protein [Propionigenium maris]|uniref:hypothetical protein n=1 Tax=Propionigenium maris TaxID=45622 RepID=UPI00248FE71D|nr:hypothetical protein [Propionigenium maris]
MENSYRVIAGTGSNATITNEGAIDVNHKNCVDMCVDGGAIAVNEVARTINLNYNRSVGMYTEGDGSTIENKRTIYLSGREVKTDYDT